VICRTQVWLRNASATVVFFFLELTAANKDGAISLMLEPFNHLSVQKKMDSPLPRQNTVAA
jgi:polyphosphate kinase 2 (PPK2 family)